MLIRIIIAMIAFAGNSVLCRLALKGMHADAISFSSIRLISGAIALFLFIAITSDSRKFEFKWLNALLLCIYVFSFSIAYVSLSTGAGALLLFGTVQLVMTVWGIAQGEKLVILKITGILGALAGIAILLFPGAERPSLYAAIMMVIAGLAWAFYSITGKKITDAAASTGGNFILAIPVALIIPLFFHSHLHIDIYGLILGVLSGAITSGGAYLLWYSLLPLLRSTTASTIQLSVPCLATLGGIIFLGETLTVRILLASVIILTGIGLVIFSDMRKGPK
ncbi:DMT family transporter [Citrobacter freundii]|uniref:DMT family transporter n=1 Tax=Citrobacter portucalensis TaxID=1639133 RepID=A0A9X4JHA0_9ENTR|nr:MULTISPECIES: DMT family transporter [Citrobacter freundii complex]MDE9616769.1 DMT family transporter [Citrobacter portucalensis]QLR77642.1 DMT family transporter [Citrobacter freundii]